MPHLLRFRVTGVYLPKAKMQKLKGWWGHVYEIPPPEDTESILAAL